MRGGAESARQRGHLVAVAVPDIELLADPFEKLRAIRDMQHAGAVFAPRAELDLPAEMLRHQLHPVADAEDRNA